MISKFRAISRNNRPFFIALSTTKCSATWPHLTLNAQFYAINSNGRRLKQIAKLLNRYETPSYRGYNRLAIRFCPPLASAWLVRCCESDRICNEGVINHRQKACRHHGDRHVPTGPFQSINQSINQWVKFNKINIFCTLNVFTTYTRSKIGIQTNFNFS